VHDTNESGQAYGVTCFWAEKIRAKSCINGEWRKYKVTEISLPEFIENWCIGMENDGLLVGTQFDQNMFGFEAKPLELVLDILTELKSLNKNINFLNFNEIDDLEMQVKEKFK
jgi:hypothetical protein